MAAAHVGDYRSTRSSSAAARRLLGRGVLYAIAILLSALLLIPFAWGVISSFKPDTEIRGLPPVIVPSRWVVENYVEVWSLKLFGVWTRNTAIIVILATIGTVLSAALAGYSFARFRYPGRTILFGLTIATIMMPDIVTLIPRFILYYQLGWLNTFLPLIVPYWFGTAFFIFLFRQFFMTLPPELDEAAKIDGASYFQIFGRIILPLSGPVVATVAIIAFIQHWDSFLFPLIVLNDPEKFTVSIGLRWFAISGSSSDARPQDHLLLAGSVMMTIPIMLLFFFGQRYFVRGVVMSGIKG